MDSKAEFVGSTCRISALEITVAGIKKELIEVKEALSATLENATQDEESSAIDTYCVSMHKSCTFVTANEVPSNLPKLHSNTSTRSSSAKPSKQELSSSVSKYNIVLYGHIKPLLSQEERLCESVLLKERWLLTQSGTSRSSIKIKSNTSLLVDNKLDAKWNKSTHRTTVFFSRLPAPTPLRDGPQEQSPLCK